MFNSSSPTLHNWDTSSSYQENVVYNSSSGCWMWQVLCFSEPYLPQRQELASLSALSPSKPQRTGTLPRLSLAAPQHLYIRGKWNTGIATAISQQIKKKKKKKKKKKGETSWKFLKVGTGRPGCSEQSKSFPWKLELDHSKALPSIHLGSHQLWWEVYSSLYALFQKTHYVPDAVIEGLAYTP